MTTREEIEDLLDIVANGISATPYIGRDCDTAFNAMPKLRAAYDALARERDALRVDAERYRVLRSRNPNTDHCLHCGYDGLSLWVGEQLDAVIDALRALDGEGAA